MGAEISARSLLRWFEVDIPSDWNEDNAQALMDYADCQERPSLARLHILEALWTRLYGNKEKA